MLLNVFANSRAPPSSLHHRPPSRRCLAALPSLFSNWDPSFSRPCPRTSATGRHKSTSLLLPAASAAAKAGMESLFAAAAVISDATQSALTDAAFSAFSAVGSSSSSSSSSQRPSDASTPRQTQPGSSLSSLPASSTSLLPSDPSSSSSGGISGRGILGPVAAAAASAGGSIASQQPSDSQSAKSWLDSWTSLVYRGEKNELQVRGMTKEEVDRLLWGE